MSIFIIMVLLLSSVAGADMTSKASNGMSGTEPNKAGVSIPETGLSLSPETSLLEEGKVLYENGQLIAALGKFMTVLRKEPRNTEARQYLHMIVDTMRQNPAISSSKIGKQEQAFTDNPAVQEEIRRMLQLRSRLTLDLKAIPSVQIEIKGNVNRVLIDTPLLFAENSGGLKEQGVPVLDRVAAWLKTYGQQPVIIHCYPEEFQESPGSASLFLHRYSELFNFFVEEKKMPAQRFISAEKVSSPPPSAASGGAAAHPIVSSPTVAEMEDRKKAQIVIETIGSQSAMLEASPSANSTRALSQWLENSITPNRRTFNPEEGEWVNLDLAAISRQGLRSWTFTIIPAEGKAAPVFQIEGKGNLLRRLSWDGHHQKTGEFVPAGSYVAKLVAINSNGTLRNQEEIVRVERAMKEIPVLVEKPRPKTKAKKPKAKAVKTVKTPVAAPAKAEPSTPPPAAASEGTAAASPLADGADSPADSDSLVGSQPAGEASAPTPAPAVPDSGDSVHAIWKQVVQFEPNQSELMPSVKSSLERIGKTLEVYPLQKVRITGFAMTSEADAAGLAQRRAEAVRSILVDQYKVDKKRVIVAGGKTTAEENASRVELSITN